MENPTCRVCGCSEYDACIHPVHGNCWWVEPDLCSHCKSWPGESTRSQESRERKAFQIAGVRQTTKKDLQRMTDDELIVEVQSIRMAYRLDLPSYLRVTLARHFFWLTAAVGEEVERRHLKIPES